MLARRGHRAKLHTALGPVGAAGGIERLMFPFQQNQEISFKVQVFCFFYAGLLALSIGD